MYVVTGGTSKWVLSPCGGLSRDGFLVNAETARGREPVEQMGALPVLGDSGRDRER